MEGGGLWGFGDLDFEATRAMAEREDAKPRTVTMQIYDSYLLKARQDLAKLFRSSARKPFSPSRIPCKPESPELGCLFFLSSESQALDVKLPYAGEDARICFWPGGGGGGGGCSAFAFPCSSRRCSFQMCMHLLHGTKTGRHSRASSSCVELLFL